MTSREKFETWMKDEQWFHGSDFEWDERRNCYAQFGIHLAYKAFLAAEGAAEQKLTDMAVQLANAESKCRELAAENAGLNNFIAESCYVHAGENAAWHPAIDHSPETPATNQFSIEESQFLTDVITAAGLLSCGKQDKCLARRITDFCVAKRGNSNPAQRHQEAAQ